MFFINFQIFWSFFFYTYILYILFITCAIIYLIPVSNEILNYFKTKTLKNFEYVSGFDLHWILFTCLFLILIINFFWTGYSLSSWFGHLFFTKFQHKFNFFITFSFYFLIMVYTSSIYFITKETHDFVLALFALFLWFFFLFYANSVFTVIFFIEILSTLIFLLLVTSTFSTTYFYNNLNLNLHNYFQQTTPFFFVQSLMFFFWISLISSLNLFYFLTLFYLKFFTFDWTLLEFIFYHCVTLNNTQNNIILLFIWFNLLFCIFLKCGIAPFYFWKPTFFKGLPLHTLLFYITFFYFFIFLFFLYLMLVYLNELFYFFININLFFFLLGFTFLLFILCEAYYIKTFLAISSVLNSLFIFLTINATNLLDFNLFL